MNVCNLVLTNTKVTTSGLKALQKALPDCRIEMSRDAVKKSSAKVWKLFNAMHEGKFDQHKFPDLTWDDVPALLELASSRRLPKHCPCAQESSLIAEPWPEGMVALWFVEGIRKGGKGFPSLNPLLGGGKTRGKALTGEISIERWQAQNHETALHAYQAWWKNVQGLPAEKARAIDPLKGTELRWY